MIISRTPFRISFFGGGTDYPIWYKENGGAVLATTINRYCYITCRYLPGFFDYKYRLVYSLVEQVNRIQDIKHPSVRCCLEHMNLSEGISIHHDGDLPARSGLGSSSSFTVGLLHALYAFKGRMVSKKQLALEAIHLEQEAMKENVGSQDQALAAFGGFNFITFGGQEHLQVQPVILEKERIESLQSHLMLFFTGFSRIASEIAAEQIEKTPQKRSELKQMYLLAHEALDILKGTEDISKFGKLLHENWLLKRSLSSKISSSDIDGIYEAARKAGAISGKLLGAGGGGFMLIFAKPQDQPAIIEKLKDYLYVPFCFDNSGSQIIFYSRYNVA